MRFRTALGRSPAWPEVRSMLAHRMARSMRSSAKPGACGGRSRPRVKSAPQRRVTVRVSQHVQGIRPCPSRQRRNNGDFAEEMFCIDPVELASVDLMYDIPVFRFTQTKKAEYVVGGALFDVFNDGVQDIHH